MIYFIRNTTSKSIKIGYAASKPENRRRLFQTGNEYDLKVVGLIEGSLKEEHRVHKRLTKHRIHPRREWFRGHSEVVKAVREMLAGDRSYLAPQPKAISATTSKPKPLESLEINGFRSGVMVEHPRYGIGRVIVVAKTGDEHRARIHFLRYGETVFSIERALKLDILRLLPENQGVSP